MPDEIVYRFITSSEKQQGGAAPSSSPGSSGASTSHPEAHAPARVPETPKPVQPTPATPSPVPPRPKASQSTLAVPAAFAAGQAAVSRGASLAGTSAISAAGGALGALGVAAAPIAAFAGALYLGKKAIDTFAAAVENARRQASGFSPLLAGAEARSEIRQIQADLRTARRLGDELARREDATSRLSTAGQRARDAILDPLLQRLLPFLELATNVAERLADLLENIPVDKIIDVAFPTLAGLSKATEQLNRLLGKRLDDKLDPILFFDQIPLPSETNPVGRGGTSVAPGFFDSPWRDATGARVDGPRFGADALEALP